MCLSPFACLELITTCVYLCVYLHMHVFLAFKDVFFNTNFRSNRLCRLRCLLCAGESATFPTSTFFGALAKAFYKLWAAVFLWSCLSNFGRRLVQRAQIRRVFLKSF